ncbi:MAG: hypothetical protein JSU68_09040 [Phycisphaerales bacterium]|nr:MAG: hypothetical protein JSU68_09040 [Phycisphaerales bacterium]
MTETSQRNRGVVWPWVIVTALTVCTALVFGTGGHFGSPTRVSEHTPATTRLAEALVALELAPELDDETLQQVVQAVMQRAREGDVEAAAFVAELAAKQRQPAEPREAGEEVGEAAEGPVAAAE